MKRYTRIAVLPAAGIGDALLMMIASHQLLLAGGDVTTFHSSLHELADWFPGHHFAEVPPREKLVEALSQFDKIIIENDNSPTIALLRSAFNLSSQPKLSIFYPSYSLQKHGPLSSYDQTFLPHLCMVDNIERAVAQLMPLPTVTNSNGIQPPASLIHRRYPNRVVIHPTSRMPEKNWLPARFMALAKKLEEQNFTPIFSVGPHERDAWTWVEAEGFSLPALPSLSALAELLYESGYLIGNDSLAGHLASNLNIPTLTIANDPKRMRLWRPGWSHGKLLFPPTWVPNIKGFRWREEKWQHFISVRRVLKDFMELVDA